MLDLGIYPLLMIVATPLFITHLGVQQYGLWMLLSNITQLMNTMNMGVGDSTIRFVSKHHATHNTREINSVVRSNLTFSLLLALLALIIGFVLAWLIPAYNWFQVNESGQKVAILITLACATAGLKFIESVLLSVFKGRERFDISAKLNLLSRNSMIVTTVIVVLLHHGLQTILLSNMIVLCVNMMVQVMVLKKFIPEIVLLPRLTLADATGLWAANVWYWLQSVIGLVGFMSDKFLVAWFTDLKTLGYYSIGAMIASQVHNIMLAFGSFIFPKVSSRNERNMETAPVYYVSRAAIAGFGWTLLGMLALTGPVLFKFWLGEETYFHTAQFIYLFIGYEALLLLVVVPFHFLNGGNLVKLNSLFEITLRTSHIILICVMYWWLGVQGLIWGLIIGTLLNLPFQYIMFHKIMFAQGLSESLKTVLPAFIIVLLMLAGNMILFAGLIIVFVAIFRQVYLLPCISHLRQWEGKLV